MSVVNCNDVKVVLSFGMAMLLCPAFWSAVAEYCGPWMRALLLAKMSEIQQLINLKFYAKSSIRILMIGWPCLVVWPSFISNLMYKILIYVYITHLLKSSTCFEHYPAHLQEVYVVIVYMQPLVLSLSVGDCPVHRLRKNWSSFLTDASSFLTGAQDSHLQIVTIPVATYIELRCRPPEDEQGNVRNM